jgi:methionine--tRNA ligase beta chain
MSSNTLEQAVNAANLHFKCNISLANAENEFGSKYLEIAKTSNLASLNQLLSDRVFVKGEYQIAPVDVFLATALAENIAKCKKLEFINLCRWYDLVQHIVSGLKAIEFELNVPAKALQSSTVKSSDEYKSAEIEEELKKKKKAEEKRLKEEAAALEEITKLDVRVGVIVEVERHPTQPDDLYVEKIDLGEFVPRTVVSGLGKFVPIEAMKGRMVAVVTNLGEADIKGVISNGLVLCASNDDHTIVEPLEPAEGSKPGEQVHYPGLESSGSPDAKLNAKKWAKIKKKLKTTESVKDGSRPFAQFDHLVMTTSAGPVTVPTLKNSFIK